MEKSPWLSIWFKPRSTMEQIVQEDPNRSVWVLAAIYGFSSLLNMFQSVSLGQVLSPLAILILAAVLAPFWGMVWFAGWSWLIHVVGKWFKGSGTYQGVRSAFAWSCVPLALNVPFWILMAFVFGQQLFLNFPEGYMLSDQQISFLFFILIAKVVFAIWSLVIYLNGLAAVQQFSVLRAIFNVIVAGAIVAAVLTVLWMLVLYALGMSGEPQKTAFLFMNDSLQLLRRGL